MTSEEQKRMDSVLRIPDETYPVVKTSPNWVAARWSSGGEWIVTDELGRVCVRWTLPAPEWRI